jgi:hypothetical protein
MSSQSGSQKVDVSDLLSKILLVKEKEKVTTSDGGKMKMKTHYHNMVKCLPTSEYNSLVSELLEKLREYSKTVQYWTNEIMNANSGNGNVIQNFRRGQHTFTRADIGKINKLYLEALARSKYVFRDSKKSCKSGKGGSKGVNTILYMSGPFQYYSFLLLQKLKGLTMIDLGDAERLHVAATDAMRNLNPSGALVVKGHVMKLTAGSMFYIGSYLSNIDKVHRLIQRGGLFTKDHLPLLKTKSEEELKRLKAEYMGGSFSASTEMLMAFNPEAILTGLPTGANNDTFTIPYNQLAFCINKLTVSGTKVDANGNTKVDAKGDVVNNYVVKPATSTDEANHLFGRMAVGSGFDPNQIPTNLVNRMLSLLDVSAKFKDQYTLEYQQAFDRNRDLKGDPSFEATLKNELKWTSDLRRYYSLVYNKEASQVEVSKKTITSAIASVRRTKKK